MSSKNSNNFNLFSALSDTQTDLSKIDEKIMKNSKSGKGKIGYISSSQVANSRKSEDRIEREQELLSKRIQRNEQKMLRNLNNELVFADQKNSKNPSKDEKSSSSPSTTASSSSSVVESVEDTATVLFNSLVSRVALCAPQQHHTNFEDFKARLAKTTAAEEMVVRFVSGYIDNELLYVPPSQQYSKILQSINTSYFQFGDLLHKFDAKFVEFVDSELLMKSKDCCYNESEIRKIVGLLLSNIFDNFFEKRADNLNNTYFTTPKLGFKLVLGAIARKYGPQLTVGLMNEDDDAENNKRLANYLMWEPNFCFWLIQQIPTQFPILRILNFINLMIPNFHEKIFENSKNPKNFDKFVKKNENLCNKIFEFLNKLFENGKVFERKLKFSSEDITIDVEAIGKLQILRKLSISNSEFEQNFTKALNNLNSVLFSFMVAHSDSDISINFFENLSSSSSSNSDISDTISESIKFHVSKTKNFRLSEAVLTSIKNMESIDRGLIDKVPIKPKVSSNSDVSGNSLFGLCFKFAVVLVLFVVMVYMYVVYWCTVPTVIMNRWMHELSAGKAGQIGNVIMKCDRYLRGNVCNSNAIPQSLKHLFEKVQLLLVNQILKLQSKYAK